MVIDPLMTGEHFFIGVEYLVKSPPEGSSTRIPNYLF